MREEDKVKLYQTLKQEIRSLLISSPKSKYGGITGGLLYFDYKQLNSGKEIPYAELGFHSFLALLRSMPDVVRIEFQENNSYYRVHPVYDPTTAHIQKMVWEQRDKFQYQNKFFDQQWRQNKSTSIKSHNFHQSLRVMNNSPYFNLFNFEKEYSSKFTRFHPQQHLSSRKERVKASLEPYLLLIPAIPLDDEKRTFNHESSLACLSSKINDHNQSSSTLDTFLETPPHFNFDDYQLPESFSQTEKDIWTDNDLNSAVNNQMNDSPLVQSTSVTSNEQTNAKVDVSLTPNDEIIVVDHLHCNEEKQYETNEKLLKRINNALRQCIKFRYIHRLYEMNFRYRHYPQSNEILSIKSTYEKLALNQYQQELEHFDKESQSNPFIDDQKCRMMFDEYIDLQRNYYYMKKIMTKKRQR